MMTIIRLVGVVRLGADGAFARSRPAVRLLDWLVIVEWIFMVWLNFVILLFVVVVVFGV